jgi:tripartite-type tricarboxylate transporter receptor subunit TctC
LELAYIAGDFMKLFPSSQPTVASRRQLLGSTLALLGGISLNLGLNLSLSANALAQTAAYPSKSITMIVPFPPGGLADIVARPVAEAMSRELGQPVVIENRGGAGGGIGMGVAARAKPDGYTVLLALSSLTVIPEADALLGRNPMFLLNELRPIARYTADPTVLAVRADSPWKTVKEFVEDARKRPGAIN